jgi:hypothetical protein
LSHVCINIFGSSFTAHFQRGISNDAELVDKTRLFSNREYPYFILQEMCNFENSFFVQQTEQLPVDVKQWLVAAVTKAFNHSEQPIAKKSKITEAT